RNPEKEKAELVEKVIAHARVRMPAKEADEAELFIRQYHRRSAPEDLIGHAVSDLYGAVLSHWSFTRRRRRGEPKIRVYNPQFEQNGWQSTHTVVEVVTDNMPFLVDSVRVELNRRGLTIHLILYPVIRVRRDAKGNLLSVVSLGAKAEKEIEESYIHIQVGRQTDPEVLSGIKEGLAGVLADVELAVGDWDAMRRQAESVIKEIDANPPPLNRADVKEDQAFLGWLEAGHFTFLGYRRYDLIIDKGEEMLRRVPGSELGILRESKPEDSVEKPADIRRRARESHLLVLTKAQSISRVHRSAPMDYIGVRSFDSMGQAVGEHRFLGLYTASAYNRNPSSIPLLRRKVARVMNRSGMSNTSHGGKVLLNILETFPRDELFQATDDELYETSKGILHLEERRRIRLFVREDAHGYFVSCLVFVPRDRYDTAMRQRIQGILLETFHGDRVEFNTRFSDSVLAQIRIIVHTPAGGLPGYEVGEIEQRLEEATRSWEDEFHDTLVEHFGEERGNQLLQDYRGAFPAGYLEDYPAWTWVFDVEHMEEVVKDTDPGMSFYRPPEPGVGRLHFKLFNLHRPIPLSEALPVLENMGLRVMGERPYKIERRDGRVVWVHDFGMVYSDGSEPDVEKVRYIFQDTFAGVWRGELENDGFNRLVLGARLTPRETVLPRAYCKYLLQTGIPFSQTYMEQTLVGNGGIARLLVELFHARFDPAKQRRSAATITRLVTRVQEAIDGVANLDQDRILRRFFSAIKATLRVNYYRRGTDGEPVDYLSFKIDPALIPDLPLPRPMFEVFVYSPRMEGIHLRGGMVARGGLRWSDRREDFRTEVLGLMKAQMVKNAVIVPVGAKGGFVAKRLPEGKGRDGVAKEVVSCYRLLIRGLLDLTDNLVEGNVVPPPDVIRYDEDDPYLVVAADKGTATFSDVANDIAREYGFWMGDAFASGGSAGYDHKKMG
ncbi:MAG: NAD-glutamate dehydrogenase, partial [Gammaproteobacteria bacterium]|nr:NAD-glutamate dehydrogenase [Gammaproteobacteria bacterium]